MFKQHPDVVQTFDRPWTFVSWDRQRERVMLYARRHIRLVLTLGDLLDDYVLDMENV